MTINNGSEIIQSRTYFLPVYLPHTHKPGFYEVQYMYNLSQTYRYSLHSSTSRRWQTQRRAESGACRGHWSKSFGCFTHVPICLFFPFSFSFFFTLPSLNLKLWWIIDWPECSLQCRSGARWNQRLQAAATSPPVPSAKESVIGGKVVMGEIYAVKQRRDEKRGNVIQGCVLYIYWQ